MKYSLKSGDYTNCARINGWLIALLIKWHISFLVLLSVSACHVNTNGPISYSSSPEYDKLRLGEISLNCDSALCGGSFGYNISKMLGLYVGEKWEQLAQGIINLDYNSDLSYFLLGRATEGLGEVKAAEIYYWRSQQITLRHLPGRVCNGALDNCKGIDLPRMAEERLKVLLGRN